MMRQMVKRGVLAAALALVAPGVQAQGDAGALNASTTNRVVGTIADVFAACTRVPQTYLPDCVGKALQSGASKISNNPAYWEAHVALTRLSRGLESAVRANRDDNAGRERAAGHRLNAVVPGALAAIARETERDIARAQDDFSRLTSREQTVFAPLLDLIVNRRPWP
jgi:hypothetical protein